MYYICVVQTPSRSKRILAVLPLVAKMLNISTEAEAIVPVGTLLRAMYLPFTASDHLLRTVEPEIYRVLLEHLYEQGSLDESARIAFKVAERYTFVDELCRDFPTVDNYERRLSTARSVKTAMAMRSEIPGLGVSLGLPASSLLEPRFL